MSRQQGVTEEKLRALADYESSPCFAAEERAVLRLADAMTETPVEVPEEVFSSVRAIYDDAELVELVSAIAWENYRARFDHAFGVEAEGFSAGAYCPLPGGPPPPEGGSRFTAP